MVVLEVDLAARTFTELLLRDLDGGSVDLGVGGPVDLGSGGSLDLGSGASD
jgi:hypothetical protein